LSKQQLLLKKKRSEQFTADTPIPDTPLLFREAQSFLAGWAPDAPRFFVPKNQTRGGYLE